MEKECMMAAMKTKGCQQAPSLKKALGLLVSDNRRAETLTKSTPYSSASQRQSSKATHLNIFHERLVSSDRNLMITTFIA